MVKVIVGGVASLLVAAAAAVGYTVFVVTAVVGVDTGASQACVIPAGVAPVRAAELNETQMRHAGTVMAVGLSRGESPQALVVALATAAQESRFLNYANDGTSPNLRPEQTGVAASLNYPHDAVGNDHGSVGIFQQQYPWWGSLAELMNPEIAAGKFFDALAEVPGWEAMPVTEAAQAVQVSAFPDAYAQWEPLARELVEGVLDDVHDLPGCGVGGGTAGAGEWALPLKAGTYRLSSGYGPRVNPTGGGTDFHTGLDFAAKPGTPIEAASSGRVVDAGWRGNYGELVIIESGNVEHYYAHQQSGSIQVQVGELVAVGQEIGRVGETGRATGPHLHFEVRVNGASVDPVSFMQQQGIQVGTVQ